MYGYNLFRAIGRNFMDGNKTGSVTRIMDGHASVKSSAAMGGFLGGAYGATSEDTSLVGGALTGAGIGAGGAIGLRQARVRSTGKVANSAFENIADRSAAGKRKRPERLAKIRNTKKREPSSSYTAADPNQGMV